jgi:hypothetical protein
MKNKFLILCFAFFSSCAYLQGPYEDDPKIQESSNAPHLTINFHTRDIFLNISPQDFFLTWSVASTEGIQSFQVDTNGDGIPDKTGISSNALVITGTAPEHHIISVRSVKTPGEFSPWSNRINVILDIQNPPPGAATCTDAPETNSFFVEWPLVNDNGFAGIRHYTILISDGTDTAIVLIEVGKDLKLIPESIAVFDPAATLNPILAPVSPVKIISGSSPYKIQIITKPSISPIDARVETADRAFNESGVPATVCTGFVFS